MALIEQGLNDCEVARRTGIPRTTIRDWRRPRYVRRTECERCWRCWRPTRPLRFIDSDYAELLAMYLGDGCISEGPRAQQLRIALDAKYPQIISATRELLQRCFPDNAVGAVRAPGCVQVYVYSSHLGCVIPQQGPGKKHDRSIVLEPWQKRILESEPWPFIRGCIRTDGCVFVNRTDVHQERPNEYLSYDFSNRSHEIVSLFIAACDQVGVTTRPTFNSARRLWQVRIYRRESVASMLEHVGMKR
jgi:hypothetical protein